MKGKAVIPLILGLVIGLVAVKLTVDAIQRARASTEAETTVTVVRAKEDIEAFVKILPDMVEAVETTETMFAPANDRIESVEQVEDRVTSKAIPQGVPVLRSMLAPEGTPAGMVGRIPTGYRAVSVKIDEVTGVAYQIGPGDWVDVIVVMDVDVGARRKETIAEVILQHVQVAAIGRGAQPEPSGSRPGVQPAKSATLLVKEEDVPKLHLAATRGKITLAMRGDDEKVSGQALSARSDDILDSLRGLLPSLPEVKTPQVARQPQEAPPPPNRMMPHEVLVFRRSATGRGGVNVERITFENAESHNIVEVNQGGPTRQMNMLELARPRNRMQSSNTRPQGGESTFPD